VFAYSYYGNPIVVTDRKVYKDEVNIKCMVIKMKLLSRILGERKVELVAAERLPVVGYDDIVLENYGSYEWYSDVYRDQASQQLDDMVHAKDLGLRNQSMLNAMEVVRIAFRDYSEGNGLKANMMTLHQLTDNYDTGLFRIGDFLGLWYMHTLNTKSVRLPSEALNAVDIMQGFPQPYVQDMKILEAIERKSVKIRDCRLIEEKPFFVSEIIGSPNQILAVKSANQWYSVLEWE